MKDYNMGKEGLGKYLVQTQSQAKPSGIKIPEVHGIGKSLDLKNTARKASYKASISHKSKRSYTGTMMVRSRKNRIKM